MPQTPGFQASPHHISDKGQSGMAGTSRLTEKLMKPSPVLRSIVASPVGTRLRRAVTAAGVGAVLVFAPVSPLPVIPALAQSSSGILGAALPSFSPLVEKVLPAVVN